MPFAVPLYYSLTIGASGAVYGVLLAYALYFPRRPIYVYFFFPIPAKYFVMIIGAISLLSAMNGPGGGVAHTTHLGGLVAAYLYLKGGSRTRLLAEIKYRYLKWRINQTRRRFDVYSGRGQTTSIGAYISPAGSRGRQQAAAYCLLKLNGRLDAPSASANSRRGREGRPRPAGIPSCRTRRARSESSPP